MTNAGERVRELWLNSTPETIDRDITEARELAPHLHPDERGYMEGLIRKALLIQPDWLDRQS